MVRILTLGLVLILGGSLHAEGASSSATTNPLAGMVGYRGPGGTCVFPDSDPPTRWNDRTGRNILWKAPITNWGHGMPTVVSGRVFVMSEPGWPNEWPTLECFDADTGKRLWARSIDHSHLIPEAERQRLLDAWKKVTQSLVERRNKKLRRDLDDAGLEIDTWRRLAKGGLQVVGNTFPTPVSDGEHVWVATGSDSFACYDMEGNLRWIRRIAGNRYGSAHDFCKYGRSPLLYNDLLLVDSGTMTRAIDKLTGKLRWSHPQTAHEVTTPTILRVDKTDILLVAGMKAYRLPDGKPIKVEGWTEHGMVMVTRHDQPNIAFFSGGGQHGGWNEKGKYPSPAGVRFSLDGDTLKATVLWSGIPGERKSQGGLGLVYHQGRVYHESGAILDAESGALIGPPRERHSTGAVPQTRHLLMIAANRIYGSDGPRTVGRGSKRDKMVQEYHVIGFDGRVLHPSHGNPLILPPLTDALEKKYKAIKVGTAFQPAYSGAFVIHGHRIYARTVDYLYCIGHALSDWPTDDPKLLAKLRVTSDVGEAAKQLDAESPRVRWLALQALARAKTLGGAEGAVRKLMAGDAYPEIRGAAAVAIDAASPDKKPAWTDLRDRMLEIEKTKRGGAWYAAQNELHPTIIGMGETGKANVIAELKTAKDPLLIRALLQVAGEAGWIDPAITKAAKAVVADWSKGQGGDKHTGTGPMTYLCAAVNEPGIPQLVFDHRFAVGDNGDAQNLVNSTLAHHTPADIRLAFAKDVEDRTRKTNAGDVVRTDVPTLILALRGLHDMGAEAKIALPWLGELAEDKDEVVKTTARWAIRGIDNE